MCPFNIYTKEQKYFLLFKIGAEDDPDKKVISEKRLGFSEVYFQFWLQVDQRLHYVFPISEEAFLS